MDELEVLTWPLYGEASKALADMVAVDDYRPDLILSIARGACSSPAASPTPWA